MLRFVHALVFALVASFGTASGAHALGSETALRANFERGHDRVGALALEAGGTRQQNASHGTAVASECSHAARGAATAVEQGATVLGHFPEYRGVAAAIGANRFNIPTKVWEAMSAGEQWAANTRFLDQMVARGDRVILATQAGAARAGSFFARELEYLASKGYRVAEDGWSMIAPGM